MTLQVFSAEDLSEASGVELFRVFMTYRAMAAAIEYMVDTQQNSEIHHDDPAAWFQKVKADFAGCITAMMDIANEAGKRTPDNPDDQVSINAIISTRAADGVRYGIPQIG